MKGEGWLDTGNDLINIFLAWIILMGLVVIFLASINISPTLSIVFEEQTQPLNFECGEYRNETVWWDSDIIELCSYRCNIEYPMTFEVISKIENPTREQINNFTDNTECRLNCFDEAEIKEEVCTNNLSYAYCNAPPDECNERYGIKTFEGCFKECGLVQQEDGGWLHIFGKLHNPCLEECFNKVDFKGFECVEHKCIKCETNGTVPVDNITEMKWKVQGEDMCFCTEYECTLSKLTCYDSKENCNRRYS